MILKILQQTTNFTKTMEAVNIASSQSTGSESDLIFPLTIGAFSICLFIFGIAYNEYQKNHPRNIYEDLISDAIERGVLEPIPENSGDIELATINLNNNRNNTEQNILAQTNTSSQINIEQARNSLTKNSQNNQVSISNNTLGNNNHKTFQRGITDVINSSTSNNREVLSNPNNSKIIEEINKRRLSNENNFKNPNNSKIIEEINKRRLSNENNFKKPNSSNLDEIDLD